MAQTTLVALRQEWLEAWQTIAYRRKLMVGLFFVVCILSTFPFFFQAIEKRHGIVVGDPVLAIMPPHNVSLAIFIIIWAISLLGIVRAAQNPYFFLTFLWSYIFLCLFRMLTISLVPLDPPQGLIGLTDPISNFFYGAKFVTRDLFFSGHTSTVFLLFLSFQRKKDRKLALISTAGVGCLLLVQHVHYTLDVLAAFFFSWVAYRIGRWIVAGGEIARTPPLSANRILSKFPFRIHNRGGD
jgi:hypothetical protein